MKSKAVTKQSKSPKRSHYSSLVLIIAGLVSSSASALNPLGPPACNLQKGQYQGGIDLALSCQDIETTIGDWARYEDGVLDDAGAVKLGTLDNFETYRAYLTVGYSPKYSWELFARLGGITGELGDEFWSEGEGFESRRELALGGGVRKTFFEEIALKIGGVVQANWTQFDGQLEASHWPGSHYLEVDMLEVQAALGATYLYSERVAFYGGPFVHLIYGDLEYVYSIAEFSNLVTWRFDWDIEEDINYGAYFGARIKLRRDCSFNIEYQQTTNAYAIGAGLMWRR